jgi:hypothetical protein
MMALGGENGNMKVIIFAGVAGGTKPKCRNPGLFRLRGLINIRNGKIAVPNDA